MLACLYNAFVLSMLFTVLMFQNTWLEMRVNLGWLFFGMIGLLFTLQTAVHRLRKLCGTFRASLVSAGVSCSGIYLVLGLEGLPVIPAAIVREGLMQNRLAFGTINAVLIVLALAGLAAVFLNER